MQHIIYLKTTNRCNLKCQHCYNEIMSFAQADMSVDEIDNVIVYIRNKLNRINKNDKILVIFHGGEPLLTDIAVLEKIMCNFRNENNISFTITTNLIYELNDQIVSFFKRLCINGIPTISTSWDYKIRFKSYKQEEKWICNVKQLLKEKINVFPIVSLTKYVIADIQPIALFQFFKSIGVSRINFERLTCTGRAAKFDIIPTNRDIDNWLFQAYKLAKQQKISVNLFESIEEAIYNNALIGCKSRKCQKYVTTINPDLTIAGCPNTANKTFGTIFNESQDLRSCAEIEEEIKKNECYVCKYFKYCNGECFQLKHDKTGCPGLKKIMDYVINLKNARS